MGGAFHAARLPEDLQPEDRSYEFADITSNAYYEWYFRTRISSLPRRPTAAICAATFKEFPAGTKAENLRHRRRFVEDERGRGRIELML